MFLVVGLTMYMPDSLYWYICVKTGVLKHAELHGESKANYSMQLLRQGYADCLSVTLKEVGEIRNVKTAVVAGGLQDNVDVTKRMGIGLREVEGVGRVRRLW